MKNVFYCIVMFVVASLTSCDNIVEDGISNDFDDTSTGKPTYVALDLSTKPNTYAGETSLKGFADEKNIANVAVFIYKWDGANANPEQYALVTSAPTNPILLKITSGTKKVFVAANIGTTSSTLLSSAIPFNSTTLDEGNAFSIPFNQLNAVIWSSGATSPGWSFSAPVSGAEEGSANGLIKALAGGTSNFSEGLLALTPTTATSVGRHYLLSNWDNSIDDIVSDNSADYASTCVFTFAPDVPKYDAMAGTSNAVTINVQLALAKATMKFDASLLHTDGYSYLSDGSDGDKGFFTPWNAATGVPGIFTAGNINKETTVFQKFFAGSVVDDNYNHINSDPVVSNDEWYKNFDNTRVFGTGKKFLTSANTLTNIYNAMTGSQAGEPNSVRLGMDTLYLTENAQEFSAGYIDNSTYLIVGGKYNPKRWISSLEQAAVVINDPIIAFNGATIPPFTPPGAVFPGTDYAPVVYNASPSSNDTLYYLEYQKLFIHGKENLCKYYAWVLKKDTDTPYNPGVGLYGVGTSPTPETSAAVIDAINLDIASEIIIGYYQGNCFYRVFIFDTDAVISNERVLVRRNHSYDVIISKILGPGIGESLRLLPPPVHVLPTDSYGAFSISIMDQHKVTQWVEVSRH